MEFERYVQSSTRRRATFWRPALPGSHTQSAAVSAHQQSMLSVPRASRQRILRRVVATILACTVLGSVAEPVIAEVHDGDAAGVAGVSATASLGTIPTSTTPTPVGSKLTGERSSATSTSGAVRRHDLTRDDAPAKDRDSHTAHVCHCAHVHGGFPVMRASLAPPSDRATTARPHSDRLPPSVAAEPHPRPPLSQPAA